jgi:uncharacterized protein YjbJ (UPF0337 family)
MKEHLDEAKGRVKKAAGALAGDRELEREGERDQAGATVKRKVRDAANAVKDGVDRAVDATKNAVNRDR